MPSFKNRLLRFILFFILGILVLLPALAIGLDALGYKAYLPQQTQDWLAIEWEGNSLSLWIQAATLAVGTGAGLVGLMLWLRHRLKTSDAGSHRLRRLARHIIRRTNSLFLILIALSAGTALLKLPAEVTEGLAIALAVAWPLQIALWLNELVADLVIHIARRAGDGDDATIQSAVTLIRMVARGVVWAITLVVILDGLGYDITALIAGLGIGGAALALASQGVLADLFGSLGIVLDKPFVVGDYIILGDGKTMGTVEAIGMKTTRIRSLSGEQVVVPNADLLAARIHNYKRMQERRVIFTLGVVYQTPPDVVEAIPGLLCSIIEAQPNTRIDRIHFAAFGPSSLDFEIVYYALTADYGQHMDMRQAINLGIMRAFAERGITFAYPTQTVFIAKEA